MFSIKPGPGNLPIDNPTLLSWNITDGDLNSKFNTLEYLNCITNIINACGVYPQDLKDREIISTFHAEKVINDLLKNDYKISLSPDTRFTSDAAHELRSPLTALKVQTEVAQLSDDDPQARKKALLQLHSGIDRATRLVDQLLTLSRLDSLDNLQEDRKSVV